jgi:hypothetical protein
MQKNKFFVLGMLAAVLALGLVFVGCDTGNGGGGGNGNDEIIKNLEIKIVDGADISSSDSVDYETVKAVSTISKGNEALSVDTYELVDPLYTILGYDYEWFVNGVEDSDATNWQRYSTSSLNAGDKIKVRLTYTDISDNFLASAESQEVTVTE